MPELDLILVLLLAMGLGALHAFDADHIAMVTSLAGSQSGFKKSVMYCTRWAFGHALTLLLLGAVVFLAGLTVPAALGHYAELAVGIFLIVIGLSLLLSIRRQQIHIHYHEHDGLPRHAHWHSHANDKSHRHKHRALFIGSLHGLAGSAPLLALIPLAVNHQPLTGFVYLILFSLGVVIAMLVFGGVLSLVADGLRRLGNRLFITFRIMISLVSIGIGAIVMTRVLA